MPSKTRSIRMTAGALIGAAMIGALGGCYYPGGPFWSADRFTYESTEWQPWTITVTDTRTGEPFWSVDVPVGQQLVVGFSEGTGPNEFKPDEIVWEIMPRGRRYGSLNNRMPCPPANARLLEPELRPTPEPVGTAMDEPRPIKRGAFRVVEPIDPQPDPRPVTDPQPQPAQEQTAPERAEPVEPQPEPADEPPIDLPDDGG